jgi:hypothetical protein
MRAGRTAQNQSHIVKSSNQVCPLWHRRAENSRTHEEKKNSRCSQKKGVTYPPHHTFVPHPNHSSTSRLPRTHVRVCFALREYVQTSPSFSSLSLSCHYHTLIKPSTQGRFCCECLNRSSAEVGSAAAYPATTQLVFLWGIRFQIWWGTDLR